MESRITPVEFVIECWHRGVAAVKGEHATAAALGKSQRRDFPFLLAVGKAASSMCKGALSGLAENGRALVITKDGHVDESILSDSRFQIIESSHPLPDERSLYAGQCAMEFVKGIPSCDELLMLVSGGASSLAELLPQEISLPRYRDISKTLLSEGYSIDRINAVRMGISLIKGGKLLRNFRGKKVTVYAISDIPGDDIDWVGSGIGSIRCASTHVSIPIPENVRKFMQVSGTERDERALTPQFDYQSAVIASNALARDAAARYAVENGMNLVINADSLNDDISTVAAGIGRQLLDGEKGVYIWGGEPTVRLPDHPGEGGRNQSLALAIAREIRGVSTLTVIAAGTDGTDGPTRAAGGVVNGETYDAAPGAEQALRQADAGTYLKSVNGLFVSGPTGTNVMDLVIALKT